MSQWLKQSTAVTLDFGPIVSSSDGVTPVTTLAAGTVDEIGVWKEGGSALTDISGTTTLTHIAGGMYTLTLSTTDVGTLGKLRVMIRDDSACAPAWQTYMVVTANFYDTACGADQFDVAVTNITDSPANKIADHTWRRDMTEIEATLDGDAETYRSGYGLMCSVVNKWYESDGYLYHTKSDDVTVIGTKAITSSTTLSVMTAADPA